MSKGPLLDIYDPIPLSSTLPAPRVYAPPTHIWIANSTHMSSTVLRSSAASTGAHSAAEQHPFRGHRTLPRARHRN